MNFVSALLLNKHLDLELLIDHHIDLHIDLQTDLHIDLHIDLHPDLHPDLHIDLNLDFQVGSTRLRQLLAATVLWRRLITCAGVDAG